MRVFYIIFIVIVQALCRDYPFAELVQNYTTAFFSCVKNSGINRTVVLLLSTQYQLIDKSVQNILNAKNAGLDVQVKYIPCRSLPIQVQYNRIVKILGNNTLSKIWANPHGSTGTCQWQKYSPSQNCEYLQKFIQYFSQRNINIGVTSWRADWSLIFGQLQGCPQASTKSQFWWTPMSTDEQDIQPNFNNYIQIGGWRRPYSKFYSVRQLCGENLFWNYYE